MAVTIVVCYDVTDDRRRARLAALLQSWGDRIQYSVFLCAIEPEQAEVLTTEMTRILDLDDDSVFILRQCKTCWSDLITLGQGEPPTEALYWEAF